MLGVSGVAAPMSGVAATIIGKTMSAILELTPLDACTTKSSIKVPVVLVTNFTLKLTPLSAKEEIKDPGSELAAAEVGWRYPRSVWTYIGTLAHPDVGQSRTNENKYLFICTDY